MLFQQFNSNRSRICSANNGKPWFMMNTHTHTIPNIQRVTKRKQQNRKKNEKNNKNSSPHQREARKHNDERYSRRIHNQRKSFVYFYFLALSPILFHSIFILKLLLMLPFLLLNCSAACLFAVLVVGHTIIIVSRN